MPQRYAEQVVRGAEYGDNRIILGAHYAMDVIAGRTIALHDLAHLLANDPRYVGQPKTHAPTITDYQAALKSARADLTALLESGCFHPVAVCATNDTGRFSNPKTTKRSITPRKPTACPRFILPPPTRWKTSPS